MDLAAGWHPDPTGRYVDRWWDGDRWTDAVRFGHDQQAIDPVLRPTGMAGSLRPMTTTIARLPTGGHDPQVRRIVAASLALPLALGLLAAGDAMIWTRGVEAEVAGAVCERAADDSACQSP